MENKKTDAWKHDAEYINYIKSGESAAVFITRDIADNINTTGRWIDVLSLSVYKKQERRAFNWIIVELFPRHLQPVYDSSNAEYNKYVTWKTANEDIEKQRQKGYCGEKWLILCNVCNVHANKYKTDTIYARKWYEPVSAYRIMKNKKPVEPKWEYKIQTVRKINNMQLKYIQNNAANLESKIRQNGRPTLEILGFQ